MIDLSAFKNRTQGEMFIRKITDDSGDYVVHHYDILAKFDWGHRCLCEGIENPFDALLWASAPDLLRELEEARKEIKSLKEWIGKAPINPANTAQTLCTDPAVSSSCSPVTDSDGANNIQGQPVTSNTTAPNSNTGSAN